MNTSTILVLILLVVNLMIIVGYFYFKETIYSIFIISFASIITVSLLLVDTYFFRG